MTTLGKKISRIPQVVAVGGSTKFCEVKSVVAGEKNKKAMEFNVDCENASNRLDDNKNNKVAEVDTEQDLHDLTLALKLLKNEKTTYQELNTLMLNLSNEVQRHKSYAKHFLGFNSVHSDPSCHIGMIMLICDCIVYGDV
jgi:hypothetical protein